MRRMSRLICARLAAFLVTAATISSCGGNPQPKSGQGDGTYRQPVSQNPPQQGPVKVAAIPPTPPPPIAGLSAIVVDVASGRVLYAKNADTPRAVAKDPRRHSLHASSRRNLPSVCSRRSSEM